MADEAREKKRHIPKGVRKGGAMFPRHPLSETLPWSKKLVSKTHLSPQPRDVVYSGIVGAKSGRGDVRISALKQYGFLDGNASAYVASDLARKMIAAPQEELPPLLAQAFLSPNIFKALYNTFQGDEVTKPKLKQRAADLNVHPEETDRCVDIYVASGETAGLLATDGEKVSHSPMELVAERPQISNEGAGEADLEPGAKSPPSPEIEDDIEPEPGMQAIPGAKRAAITVNVTLDSSLDTDKLERQLQLLKRYGAL